MSKVRLPINCSPLPNLLFLEKDAACFLKKVKTMMIPVVPERRYEINLISLLDKNIGFE